MVQQYATQDSTPVPKKESHSRALSAGKNPKRVNSAQNPSHLRSQSHGRGGSSRLSKNHSLIANSSIMDERDLNGSKDFSYMKENPNDISHMSGVIVNSAHMKNDDITIDLGRDTIISPCENGKAKLAKNFFFERGKALFKDKQY